MTPESFNYLMCPIRTFKEVVRHIDAYMNFVFAADVKGNVLIALIDENDLENDEDVVYTVHRDLVRELDWLDEGDYAEGDYEEDCEDYEGDQLGELNH